MQKLSLVTNQFEIKLQNKYLIHTYSVEVCSEAADGIKRMKEIIGKVD